MRKTVFIMALALALLGVLGAKAASSPAFHPVVAYAQQLAAVSPLNNICGGGSSVYC